MTNVLCDKCGKVVLQLVVGSKTRNGMVIFCSKKCWKPPQPNNDVHEFMNALFGGKL